MPTGVDLYLLSVSPVFRLRDHWRYPRLLHLMDVFWLHVVDIYVDGLCCHGYTNVL